MKYYYVESLSCILSVVMVSCHVISAIAERSP